MTITLNRDILIERMNAGFPVFTLMIYNDGRSKFGRASRHFIKAPKGDVSVALYDTVEYQLLLYAIGTFVLVPILSGFWSEVGKDLYAWLKTKLLG